VGHGEPASHDEDVEVVAGESMSQDTKNGAGSSGARDAMPAPKADTSPLHGLWALTKRDLQKWYTNPYQLIISLIQPVIWMGLFGKAINFSSFITAGAGGNTQAADQIMIQYFGTTSYFSYLVCGMLIFIVLFTSAFSGMSVVWDRRFGFMNKALSTPVSRGTIVMAKILQSVGRSIIQAVVVLVIGIALGMDVGSMTVLGVLGAFVVIFLVAMGLSGLFVMLSLRSSNWQTQMAVINLLNLPLLFASNALFPLAQMPGWLQSVAKLNPISYAIDGIRQLLIGANGMFPLWTDLVVVFGFAAFFSIVGIVMSWKLLGK